VTLLRLVPLGGVDPDVLLALRSALAGAFGVSVSTEPERPLPLSTFDSRRGQYNSLLVLRELLPGASASSGKLLAVTEGDLFIPMLTFVFGQAQVPGSLALVSLARLRPEFYGLPPDPPLLSERAAKEAVHEVGHSFGLIHCGDKRCPMALSTAVWQVDEKGLVPCPGCAEVAAEEGSAPGKGER
jgi:archaemetzincin